MPISGFRARAHAEIVSIDLDAVRAAPGVVARADRRRYSRRERRQSSVGAHDEPVFATDEVQFWGQPLFAVVAETRDAARRAAALAKIEYRRPAALLDVDAAMAAGGELVTEPLDARARRCRGRRSPARRVGSRAA